jgi:fumarate reductase flavoprotein subunit
MEQRQADVVVIGSGATGLTAALTAAEGGASVIVYEKERSLGGTANFFEGTFAVESALQRKRYITFTRDEAFHSIMDYSHWKANPRLVRAVVNESAGTIDWLMAHGVEFADTTINMPNSPQTYHIVKGKGEAVVKALSLKIREKGGLLKTSTPVKRILKQRDKLAGVVIEEDDEEVMVRANAVVVASGGFINNREWVKKYAGFDLDTNLFVVGNVDKMGDGIRMAWEAGAAEEGIGTVEVYRVGPVGPEFAMGCQIEFAVTQPDLFVGHDGRRFCDESIQFYDTAVGNAHARLKGGYSFTIFDTAIVRRMVEHGVDKNVGVAYMPGARPLDLEKEMRAALDRGTTELFEADTVEELAGKMGCDPAVLRATVDEYNAFCEKGHDDLFAKDPRYLWPIRGPKFYAGRAKTVCLGSMGGIRIDEHARAVDKNGNVIPGLYAGGFDAGGMYGDSYPISGSSGLCSAFALNSGRLAGKHILGYLGK